jgi:FixJ family two-component response regulator
MLTSAGESLPIIFLTGRADIPATVKAMKQGAADFLTKPIERAELVNAVRSALTRDLAARQARQEVEEVRKKLATLTPREYEVFEHVISGKLNKQTAAELGAAEKTIKVHRGRVMDKMNVQSVAELVRLAERAGISVGTTAN